MNVRRVPLMNIVWSLMLAVMVLSPSTAEAQFETITNWFNRDAVVIPTNASQPFGNAPRNSVRGPLLWQIDMVLQLQLGGKISF